ncbi:hypothetical protein [Pseudomonas aeruginosa]|uniref:hypothetical protein n=1 Tax=Pseudomonas aeruginosa TaxID=287 RepID=UPI000F533227|nr:hypothetical protein [Pseudomonas aeruginosa]RPT93829.1 hypothetical protein IPC940_07960 [Pseudomonas aeruginosa]
MQVVHRCGLELERNCDCCIAVDLGASFFQNFQMSNEVILRQLLKVILAFECVSGGIPGVAAYEAER